MAAAKAGYMAPGVEGQARVIAAAQAMAGVDADSIGYVEAHGTGTPLGDPVEIAALTRAFLAGVEHKVPRVGALWVRRRAMWVILTRLLG